MRYKYIVQKVHEKSISRIIVAQEDVVLVVYQRQGDKDHLMYAKTWRMHFESQPSS